MSGPAIQSVERASERLAEAIDRMDADAIFRATDDLSHAVQGLRALDVWTDDLANACDALRVEPTGRPQDTTARLQQLSRRIGSIRRRVNLMTDHARQHVDGLTLLGARVPPAPYAARR